MGVIVRGPRITRQVQEYIKAYIIDNDLKAGDPLPAEGHLAEEIGASRGSVREAMRALETLGILEVQHGNGIYVRGFNFDSMLDLLSYGLAFDPDKISEIMQIRKWLETAAIGAVIERIGPAELGELEEVLARWQEKVGANESRAAEDRAFHRILFGVLGNESLIGLIDVFWTVFHQVRIGEITTDRVPTTTVQHHYDILAAVRARDVRLAQRCIEEHFYNLEQRIAQATSKAERPPANGA